MFDALNGKQELQKTESNEDDPVHTGETKEKGNHINYRDEPVAFFFVLFGLAFDALVSQSCTPAQTLEILQALQKILHPSVAGNAVYQDSIFSETIDTLNRMVMTENLAIQSVIVQIVRSLSLHHPSATRENTSTEHLSDDIEQLFELTRNIILVIAGVLPNLGESSPKARSETSEESISLIQHSLSSLVDITSVFPSIIRDDLHTCVVHIFTTVFATGSCQAEIVPTILPIFKRFLQKLCQPGESQSKESCPQGQEALSVSRQIRGCLARFLGILTVAQRRESDTSLPCAKNTLLGITIILTTASSAIPPQDPLISRAMQELLDCLQDLGLGGVAASCVRSLLLNPGARSSTDEVIARTLFPRLLAFVTKTPIGMNNEPPIDAENMKYHVTQTLVSVVGSPAFTKAAIPAAMALLIPAFLTRAKHDGASVYQETATRLLELAKIDQIAFRGFATNMEQGSKGLLEEILKTVGQKEDNSKRHEQGQERNAPTIALRMDF